MATPTVAGAGNRGHSRGMLAVGSVGLSSASLCHYQLGRQLLIWIGVIRGRLIFLPATPVLNRTGLGLFLFALVAQPLIGPLMGRAWLQVEIFGIAPDPTVTATLGILLLAANKTYWRLLIIPFLWCAISGATLWTMDSPDAFLMPLAAILVLMLALWKTVWFHRKSFKE